MVEETAVNSENSDQIEDSNKENVEGPKVFTLEILRVIKESQQQHGLRHGDFQRYRGYCSRRVRRLRKVLKIVQGDKRHFKKKDVTIVHLDGKKADERFLHIPLMLAERTWSYAMQLRQEANTELRKRFHLVSKMRKACFYAMQLQELCNTESCDARTKLEAEAYVAWMHGTLHFELSLWQKAAENLKKAQLVYENLALALPEEEQALYKAKVDELTPSLRYCAYNIGDGGSMDELIEMKAHGLLDNIGSLVAQTKTESSEAFQTTDWRGRKFTVRPEKVRLFLLSLQEMEKSIEKTKSFETKIEILETILMDCKDAITSVKDEIKQDPKLRSTSTDKISGIQYLLAYLSYIRLYKTLERNFYMVGQSKQSLESSENNTIAQSGTEKKARPQDLTRLYEIILQNISELQQITGMETDSAYQAELETLATAFKSFRCYYIAVTLVGLKRWKEAVAMYERSTKYAKDSIAKNISVFNLKPELTKLITTIEGCKFSALAYSVLEDDTIDETVLYGKEKKSSKPLFERLSQYKEDPQLNSKNPNVFKLTPEMEPIPCKPLFFDLAMNFIDFPNLDDKLESSPKKGAPAGISGFVKGFLGWGGQKK